MAEKDSGTPGAQEYDLRIVVDRLRREVYQQANPAESYALLQELRDAEDALANAELKRTTSEDAGVLVDASLVGDSSERPATRGDRGTRSAATTGLDAKVSLRMAHIPTAIYHLLDQKVTPLLSCEVKAIRGGRIRRVRVRSYIEGYSAKAVNSAEIGPGDKQEFNQLPPLFADRIRGLNEITRAMLNIEIEDLDGKTELHHTEPIWLLARTSAPFAVRDPKTGKWKDLSRYFGAFVTPNAPSILSFLRKAAEQHDKKRLVGYQGTPDSVEPQLRALFTALKNDASITYVNSVIDFNPEQGAASQRVRLPSESLTDQEANCIDGTVLFASLLEGISMNPALVLVPGHALVAWETWRDSDGASDEWQYLETTMIGSHSFEEACEAGEKIVQKFRDHKKFRQWSLHELRTKHVILPME